MVKHKNWLGWPDSLIHLNFLGYFRVNYDEDHWHTILQSLRTDHNILSVNDRSVLIDDAFNLAKFNYLNYSIVLEMLECWKERETDYLPWRAALLNLEFVYKNSVDLTATNHFNVSMNLVL